MYGNLPTKCEEQDTMQRADIRTLCMNLLNTVGASIIDTDNLECPGSAEWRRMLRWTEAKDADL